LTIAPTPFNSSLDITVNSQFEQDARLEIRDISGRTIAELYDGKIGCGSMKFHWNSSENIPSGTYLIILDTDNGKIVRKAVLIR